MSSPRLPLHAIIPLRVRGLLQSWGGGYAAQAVPGTSGCGVCVRAAATSVRPGFGVGQLFVLALSLVLWCGFVELLLGVSVLRLALRVCLGRAVGATT
jgi:hypothetical protein